MPTLESTWFNLNKDNNDIDNVLDFLKKIPKHIIILFNQPSFIKIIDTDSSPYEITWTLFLSSISEAENILKKDIELFQTRVNRNAYARKKANDTLLRIGFTGNSLELKAKVLNKLVDSVIRTGEGLINFASKPLVKAIRKLLTYLNSILGSLTKLIPAVDAIKEIKEVGESYLTIIEK